MSNAISRAARDRMAKTGEPYTLARRMVIEERARSLAAVDAGTGLVSLDPPAPVPNSGPIRDAEGGAEAEFLSRLFGPTADQPSSGPPYTHMHRLPETGEEMAAALWPPITHTITKDGE